MRQASAQGSIANWKVQVEALLRKAEEMEQTNVELEVSSMKWLCSLES
jgi:hypothetical protein